MSSARSQNQLAFDLSCRPALGAEDFLVSGSNAMAVEMIDAWPEWSHPRQLLTGPAASGKSHLVNVWRLRAGAAMVRASELDRKALLLIGQGQPLCVEDIDRSLASEEALFHLLNLAREKNTFLLLTSRLAAHQLKFTLPDLNSRLRAIPQTSIKAPDEQLLMAVMIKLFDDRQIRVGPGLVRYIVLRMERSMQMVRRIVSEMDRISLASRRPVGKALAREIMAGMERQGGSLGPEKEG